MINISICCCVDIIFMLKYCRRFCIYCTSSCDLLLLMYMSVQVLLENTVMTKKKIIYSNALNKHSNTFHCTLKSPEEALNASGRQKQNFYINSQRHTLDQMSENELYSRSIVYALCHSSNTSFPKMHDAAGINTDCLTLRIYMSVLSDRNLPSRIRGIDKCFNGLDKHCDRQTALHLTVQID